MKQERQVRAEATSLPRRGLFERITLVNISFWLFILLVLNSLPIIRTSGRGTDVREQLTRFISQFFPPDFSITMSVLASLWETIQMAAVATALGVLFSLIVGLAGARGISPLPIVWIARVYLNFVRTLPSLIWALVAVAVFGANTLAGVIGLTFYSMGYLGKFFSEAFESLDLEVVRGLRQLGADRWQAFQYGLWPSVRPLVWSHTIWMLEYNIRSASIIGYVGAGGIGLQLLRYQEFGQWDRFATVLLFIFIIVFALDGISWLIRKKLVSEGSGSSA